MMEAAKRLLHWCPSYTWLFTLLLTVVVLESKAALTGIHCTASTEPNATKCDIPYLERLVLSCPGSSGSSTCQKQSPDNASVSEVMCNCSHGQCTVNPDRSLRYEDSGLYFCGEESNHLYANVNVLAPPSLQNICNTGCFCNDSNNDKCYNTFVIVDGVEGFPVSVNYTGSEPSSVQWFHNGTKISCDGLYCENHTSQDGSTYSQTLVITPSLPNLTDAAGIYMATVTNSYGWNSSITEAKLWCNEPLIPKPLPILSPNTTVVEGSNVIVQCGIMISRGAHLYVCYGQPNETFSDLDQDKNCAECFPLTPGACNTMQSKPQWKIHREIADPCFSMLTTTVRIEHASLDDSGKIFCAWHDDERATPKSKYADFLLTVQRNHLSALQLGMYTAMPLAVVLIAGLVVTLVIVKKWKPHRRGHTQVDGEDSETSPISTQATRKGGYGGTGPTNPIQCGIPRSPNSAKRREPDTSPGTPSPPSVFTLSWEGPEEHVI